MRKKTEVIDFRTFLKQKKESNIKVVKKGSKYKTIIKIGVASIVVLSVLPLPMETASAIETLAQQTPDAGLHQTGGWENLITKLLELLDPIAKIFGMIAGIAIMTGNGKIGLERLLWLSLGYITTRNVDSWIAFLGSL